MATTPRRAIIVGGGLSGLFSALLVSERDPGLEVHVIERDAAVGGGHGSFFDPEGGCFDHGMHLMFDSLVPEVDRHFGEMLAEQDWIILSGNRKDIAGIYHGGRLQENSPYPDLRALPDAIREECAAGLLRAAGEEAVPAARCASTDEFFRRRFGDAVTERVIDPILRKLWRRGGKELAPMASRIVLLDRVLLYDAPTMLERMQDPRVRARIGFPEQMALPLEFRNAQRGYYPRKYGMYRVMEALAAKLTARGVRLHLRSEIASLDIAGRDIHGARIAGPGGETVLDNIALLHWTIPLFALAPKLGVTLPALSFDPPLPQAHAYFLLKQAPRMGELYSFYCFDPGYATFRVTSYAAYCPDARRADGSWPVCVELHFDPGSKPEEAAAARLAAAELQRMGLIAGPQDIAFSRAVPARIGFPTLTHGNAANLGKVRELVDGQGIRNLLTVGFAPERGVFFAHDVLEQNYLGLNAILGGA